MRCPPPRRPGSTVIGISPAPDRRGLCEGTHGVPALVNRFWSIGVGLLLLLAGCSVDPVRISERCEPLTEPVLLHPLDFSGRFSIGIVDEHLMFSYLARTGDPERPNRMFGQWFDAELSAASELFWLGDSRGAPAWRWVGFGHRLWAQIFAVPQASGALPVIRRTIGIYSVAPGSADFERTGADLPISTINDSRPDLTPVGIGSS